MRAYVRIAVCFGFAAGVVASSQPCSAFPPAAKESSRTSQIEAVKGKQYKLTKQHGPWMIMVATLSEPPAEYKTQGITPAEAADQLVYELRQKGIPAYVFSHNDVIDELRTTDRLGRVRNQSYVAQRGSISVLAGNYKHSEDPVAAKTLEFIKAKKLKPNQEVFEPKLLAKEKAHGGYTKQYLSGAVARTTPGRPTPLSGAFLTINPLLSPQEVSQREVDPLLVKLNSESEYSLARNQKKYTLVVASFYGQAQTKLGRKAEEKAALDFKVSSALDDGGLNALQLCQALRNGKYAVPSNHPRSEPTFKKFDAYVFHDRNRSLVTIGGFDSADDPEIRRLFEQFRAKEQFNQGSKQKVLTAEKLMIPAVPPRGSETDPTWQPEKLWIFDPQPIVMAVPKLTK